MISPVLYVSDVDKSLAFYIEMMGAMPGNNFVGADGKSISGEVRFGDTRVILQAAPTRAQCYCPMEFRIDLEPDVNIRQLYVEMRVNGVTMFDDLNDDSWGEQTFGVEDPDGFRWRLVRTAYALVGERFATASMGGM